MPPGTAPLPICVLKNGMPRAPDELRDIRVERGRDGGGAEHHQRALGVQDQRGGAIERRGACHRQLERMRRNQRHLLALLGGDVFGQLQMDRPRPLLLRDAEGVAHESSGSSRR